jgi:ubiquinone/menaquinone biosynthesis C-methylase UbiE
MIKFFKNIFWYPFSSKNNIEKYQKQIRDIEWDSFKEYIPTNSNLLDVGCGSGDNLSRAASELKCKTTGIDPAPGAHGVGRFTEDAMIKSEIIQGNAENLPFENKTFDVVFCSHVLEHVNNEHKSLTEIARVTKENGTIIIGMPTASMTIIGLISHYLLTTHVNILFFIKHIGKKEMLNRFIHIFLPKSHSYPNHRFFFYDLHAYRVSRWTKLVNSEFSIKHTITPCLYPYPDYIQFFPKIKNKKFSSSVFFICTKK